MSFEVYPSDFSTRYELRHAISTIMTIHYNDIGKLVLVAPVNDYNITALKVGNLLYDTDRDVTFIIANTKIETDTNRITANGYTYNWILNKRWISLVLNTAAVGLFILGRQPYAAVFSLVFLIVKAQMMAKWT